MRVRTIDSVGKNTPATLDQVVRLKEQSPDPQQPSLIIKDDGSLDELAQTPVALASDNLGTHGENIPELTPSLPLRRASIPTDARS